MKNLMSGLADFKDGRMQDGRQRMKLHPGLSSGALLLHHTNGTAGRPVAVRGNQIQPSETLSMSFETNETFGVANVNPTRFVFGPL